MGAQEVAASHVEIVYYNHGHLLLRLPHRNGQSISQNKVFPELRMRS
jgi:hypothetical protein